MEAATQTGWMGAATRTGWRFELEAGVGQATWQCADSTQKLPVKITIMTVTSRRCTEKHCIGANLTVTAGYWILQDIASYACCNLTGP